MERPTLYTFSDTRWYTDMNSPKTEIYNDYRKKCRNVVILSGKGELEHRQVNRRRGERKKMDKTLAQL